MVGVERTAVAGKALHAATRAAAPAVPDPLPAAVTLKVPRLAFAPLPGMTGPLLAVPCSRSLNSPVVVWPSRIASKVTGPTPPSDEPCEQEDVEVAHRHDRPAVGLELAGTAVVPDVVGRRGQAGRLRSFSDGQRNVAIWV